MVVISPPSRYDEGTGAEGRTTWSLADERLVTCGGFGRNGCRRRFHIGGSHVWRGTATLPRNRKGHVRSPAQRSAHTTPETRAAAVRKMCDLYRELVPTRGWSRVTC